MSSEIFRREVEAHALGTTADLLAAVGRAREEREASDSVGTCVGKRFDSSDQLQELRLALAQQAALAAERELELRLSGMAASLDWGLDSPVVQGSVGSGSLEQSLYNPPQ